MRLAFLAAVLLAAATTLWLLHRESPEHPGELDTGAVDTGDSIRDAGVPLRPSPQHKPATPRADPTTTPSEGERSRDRVGSGTESATIRVLDHEGAPVVGAQVIAILRKPPGEARPIGAMAHSTETGHATLKGLPKGEIEELLVMPPANRLDLARHTLPSWVGEDTVAKLPQGYTLMCVVRDHAGAPLPRATISMSDRRGGATGYAVDAEGRHSFKHLPAGSYEVRARLGTKTTGPVHAEAGGPEVVLEIDNRGSATIRIEGWKRGAFEPRGRLTPDPRKGPSHIYMDVGTSDGTITVHGANPDAVYTLWLGARDGQEVVYETDLRIDGRELVVRPQRALTISGRLIAPPDSRITAINVNDAGVHVKGTWVEAETYEVRGLPEGTWNVSARGRCPEGRLSADIRVQAGDTADLELKLKR